MLPITSPADARRAVEKLRQELAQTASLKKIIRIHDRARAAVRAIRNLRLGPELLNKATEVQLRAGRKAGKLLNRRLHRGGDHKSARRPALSALRKLGISGHQSADWQRIAGPPLGDFTAHIRQVVKEGKLLSIAEMIRWVQC